ncbi:MAG: amidohydrolase family protein [Chloroflexi bacterium]|nr:amidohydrolase family protein [Chloroflexota bacterium]
MPPVIDAHVHLLSGTPGREYLPPRYRWDRVMHWAYGGNRPAPWDRDPATLYPQQEVRSADPDGTATVAAMDKAGVNAGVLIHADFGPSRGELQPKGMEEMHQDYVNIAQRHPGRFYPFAGPDVRRPGSLDLVKAGLKDGRFKGLKVMPQVGYYASDRMLYPFYEACLEADAPVAICSNYESSYSRAIYNDPIYISDVVADFPDLSVIIFHSGVPYDHWFDICAAIGRVALNVYLEFAGWLPGFVKKPWLTEEDIIRKLAKARDTVGAHRMLMGSDGQFAHSPYGQRRTQGYVRDVQFYRELPQRARKYGVTFSQEEVDLIMGLNMARVLKLVDMPEYTKRHKFGWKVLMPAPRPVP